MPYGIPDKRWKELSKFQQGEAKLMYEMQQERKKKKDTRTMEDIAPKVKAEPKEKEAPKKKKKTPTAEELARRERKRKRGYYSTGK